MNSLHLRRIGTALLTACLLSCLNLQAQDSTEPTLEFTVGSLSYAVTSDSTCSVKDIVESQSSYIVPEEIELGGKRYKVTSVAPAAFAYDNEVTHIELPESITEIEKSAFCFSKNLQYVNLPKALTTLGEYAFFCCYSLTRAELPDGLKYIEKMTFSNCRELQSVHLPEQLLRVGLEAFNGCKKLGSLRIPASVTFMFQAAFHDCSLDTLWIADSNMALDGELATFGSANTRVLYIGRNLTGVLFDSTTGIDSICIGASVTRLPSELFLSGNVNLRAIRSCNPVPPQLGSYMFRDTTYATAIVYVPESSLSAYREAKEWQKFLHFRTFPDGEITAIEQPEAPRSYAFEGRTLQLSSPGRVYRVDGRPVFGGTGAVTLPPGGYVIQVDGAARKVWVR
jgi:hypothetical protein